jgi:hypothetical protein
MIGSLACLLEFTARPYDGSNIIFLVTEKPINLVGCLIINNKIAENRQKEAYT